MNVWHIYARYYNYGDHALGMGVRNLFLKYFSNSLLFKPMDTHSIVFNEGLLNNMNSTADLLLVGGGGLIHWCGGNDWMFKMPNELIPKIRIPSIVFGVGYNRFRTEAELPNSVVDNLKLLNKKCLGFSVRNDGSKKELLKLGIETDEVPDPGFFLDGNYPRPDINHPYVIIQLANDMKAARGYTDADLLTNFKIITEHIISKGYTVVLCPHVRVDIALSKTLMDSIGPSPFIKMWDWFQVMSDENCYKGLAYYKYAKFVIGMRGHAQIIPIGMKVPVISIGSHRKNLDLVKTLDIASHYVEVGDAQLGNKVIAMIADIENNYGSLKLKYENIMQELTTRMENYITKLSSANSKKDK